MNTVKQVRKAGRVARLEGELVAQRGLVQVYKQQVEGLLMLEKQLIERLAALGVRVRYDKGHVVFEAAGGGSVLPR